MVIASRYTSAPIPDATLAALFRATVAKFATRTALVDGPSGRSYTFQQLLDHSASIANAFVARGIVPGDRIAFVVPNVPEAALAYHGTLAAGAVAMMLNPLSTAEELARYFELAPPKLVITVEMFAPAIAKAAPQLDQIVLGAASFAGLLGGSVTPPAIAVAPDDVAVMPFSSGTTGFPKGVMLTHRNLIAQYTSIEGVTDSDVIIPEAALIAVLPFFHIYGIMAFLTFGLIRGAKVVCMPRFDLAQYVELVRTHRPPILHVVPPILLALAKYPGELDLAGVESALSGAAPLSAELAAQFTQRTGVLVYQVYGMTEVTGASHLASRRPERNKPGSIGGLVANCEARVISPETGLDVAAGERGEIWVRAPYVMKGYHANAKETAETIDRDGFLHTGDVGYIDGDGDFFVVDRVKELIKYKGQQVAPAELEAVLLQHPDVVDCAVYPKADAEAGELPKAAVVLRPGATVTAEELMAFVAERVAPQKKLRELTLIEAIPKSTSGKILRRVLVANDLG